MDFKLTTKVKDGYREIIRFKNENEDKSFTSVSLYRNTTVIVRAKNKAQLLKDIEKNKSKSLIDPKIKCVNLMLLDFRGLDQSNLIEHYYSDYNNVEDDDEAKQLAESGEMLEECFLEMELPITVK